MNESKGFSPIFIPAATVFISSACIMILELVASRLIARHLGSSLYTWTAVIGVVLAGITIGNYSGGRIADKFKARKALSVIFILSSAACVSVVILNNLVGEWIWLWKFNWPIRVFGHVALVFLGPSLLLGTISPVVAKMAIDRGLSTGRTIGDIYAWGAAGSILGTFAAGFYLIPTMGTIAIVWSIGAVLLIMGILYWVRLWPAYIWMTVFLCALVMGITPAEGVQKIGAALSLREKYNPNILYEDETAYSYVTVKRLSQKPDKRAFIEDKLLHSIILMDNKYNLQYFYPIIFAAVTHGLSDNKKALSVLHIGGGGYVFPQYIEHYWPASRNDVAEIDPGVTKAAMAAFGLPQNTSINTIQMDARNYVDKLIQKELIGIRVPKYDFIYEDAFSDCSVPYQLVTKEFNDKIYNILTDNGVYMANIIDIYESGLFAGNYLYTLEQTFPHVYVALPKGPKSRGGNFVLIASKIKLDVEKYITQYRPESDFRILNENELQTLRNKTKGKILNDDYAPVENLLAPTVNADAKNYLVGKKLEKAAELKEKQEFEEAISEYEEIIKTDPTVSVMVYDEMAFIKLTQGKLQDAAETLKKAIVYNQTADFKDNLTDIYNGLGMVLKQLGKTEESLQYYKLAIEEYRQELASNPKLSTIVKMGNTLAMTGNLKEASVYFSKAVDLDPTDLNLHVNLIQSLELQGRYDEAIVSAKDAISLMQRYGKKEDLQKLNQIIESLESKKSK
jgi:tetratricopeptide (TPR) repeat protein/MFS family permease